MTQSTGCNWLNVGPGHASGPVAMLAVMTLACMGAFNMDEVEPCAFCHLKIRCSGLYILVHDELGLQCLLC